MPFHKQNYPFRIIISSVDSSLCNLASFLHELIVESVSSAFSNINNSIELLQKLKNVKIDHGYSLISDLDVSLFTNIHTTDRSVNWVYLCLSPTGGIVSRRIATISQRWLHKGCTVSFRIHLFYFRQSILQTDIWNSYGIPAITNRCWFSYKTWRVGCWVLLIFIYRILLQICGWHCSLLVHQ